MTFTRNVQKYNLILNIRCLNIMGILREGLVNTAVYVILK